MIVYGLNTATKLVLSSGILVAAITWLTFFGVIQAQSQEENSVIDTAQNWEEAAEPPEIWEKEAGGKASFDVASVKQDTAPPSPDTVHSNIDLGFALFDTARMAKPVSASGGLFSETNHSLWEYISFAYKLWPQETSTLRAELPGWAMKNRYDIEARASGIPTKDQYRLMLQALLADRFKLAVHFETKEMPVFALVLDKSGKLGPHLRPHDTDAPCNPIVAADAVATIPGGFPQVCDTWVKLQPDIPPLAGSEIHVRAGARDVPIALIASFLGSGIGVGIDRPVVDRTGLTGTYDLVIEIPITPNSPTTNGPAFLEALRDQLGLKLKSTTAPLTFLVVDDVEPPSPN
jgi:uncharacterized protein (TIGR03435 family)